MTIGTLYYYHLDHWEVSFLPPSAPNSIINTIAVLSNYTSVFYSQFKFKFITSDAQHSPSFDIENIWIVQCWLATIE